MESKKQRNIQYTRRLFMFDSKAHFVNQYIHTVTILHFGYWGQTLAFLKLSPTPSLYPLPLRLRVLVEGPPHSVPSHTNYPGVEVAFKTPQ